MFYVSLVSTPTVPRIVTSYEPGGYLSISYVFMDISPVYGSNDAMAGPRQSIEANEAVEMDVLSIEKHS